MRKLVCLRHSIYLALVLLVSSCSLTTELKLTNFDKDSFRKDKLGCNNIRQSMILNLDGQKKQFLGISENEIFYGLGKYDYQGLDKKNEKVFVYFLEKGDQCTNLRSVTAARCLVIKLNSVSLVKEVFIQKGGFQ